MNKNLLVSIRDLLSEMLEDEIEFKNKPNDIYAQGQLSASQYNRVKLEALLERSGSNRASIIEGELACVKVESNQ